MHLFASASGHDWPSFALGVLAGIVCVVAVKQYNKRKDS
jgi:ammonia channel protein AmtB